MLTALEIELAFEIGPVVRSLHLIAVFVFALSGALAAAQKNQTFVTFCFFALAVGVGGGTVRDLLIGAPVFWMQDSLVPFLCLVAAVLVWIVPSRIMSPAALDWSDAIGLAAYSVFGASKALSLGIDPVPAALMGVITACAGGIVRDMLSGEPSIIMNDEIYVTASALAAGLFVALYLLAVPMMIAAIISALVGFALRASAMIWGLSLPSYKRRIPVTDD